MRIIIILVLAIAALIYGFAPPATPPSAPTMFAQVPPKPSKTPRSDPRSEVPRAPQARPPAPLDIKPQAQQDAVQKLRQAAQASEPEKSKRTAEVLTAAAIAALIVAESRRAYYSTGHPCACPDDRMRNGRACGGRSAYSRPGGRSPLCYPTDVTEAMIKSYRERQLAAR